MQWPSSLVFWPILGCMREIPSKRLPGDVWHAPWILAGDPGQAQLANRAFLGFWAEGSPELPLLQQAKADAVRLLDPTAARASVH